jgi:NAD(P)-dependent dehydrogenase (short-subunit alcohol dehydrogenase family)
MPDKGLNQVFVVTGATSGIGYALAQTLLKERAAIIGVGRSKERCGQAEQRLRSQFPEAQLAYCVADLSLQREVRQLAQEIGDILRAWDAPGLDGLVNNAGAFTFWRTITAEGFETQWAVNHLAPFLLTHKLLPLLQLSEKAKVITVSSGSHRNIALNWDDIQLLRFYNPLRAYKQTKLANVLFTLELNRRLGPNSNVRAFAADPGLSNTGMGEKTGFILAGWYWQYRRRKGIPAEESAAGIASLLLNPQAAESGEIYWKHGSPVAPDPHALDPVASERLWRISASMCNLDEAL